MVISPFPTSGALSGSNDDDHVSCEGIASPYIRQLRSGLPQCCVHGPSQNGDGTNLYHGTFAKRTSSHTSNPPTSATIGECACSIRAQFERWCRRNGGACWPVGCVTVLPFGEGADAKISPIPRSVMVHARSIEVSLVSITKSARFFQGSRQDAGQIRSGC